MNFITFSRVLTIRSQASGSYDPSFVTEILREIQHSDTADQDINLLKDVAAQTYLGKSGYFTFYFSIKRENTRGSGYHCFGNRNFLFGDGLLSRGTEGGSKRT